MRALLSQQTCRGFADAARCAGDERNATAQVEKLVKLARPRVSRAGMAKPSEMGRAIWELVSDGASYVSGTTITVDGGMIGCGGL